MKKGVFLLLACVLFYVRSVSTDSEMVWLKDVTTHLDTKKRTLSDLDLPDELTFYLRRASHVLTLNLKRNHGIDPNADVYVVRTLKNGGSLLEKARNSEKEDVAYYQDRSNGAFMTVRCVKRSNGQCDRLINGNIRLGDINYDLRPAETDVTSRNLFDVPDFLGTRYVLHDQANIQRDVTVNDKDAGNFSEKNVEKEFIHLLRRSPRGQKEPHHVRLLNSTLSARNDGGLHNKDQTEKVKQVYWIEIAVLIDSSIWDLFVSLVQTNYVEEVQTNSVDEKDVQAKRNIRTAYSHIINGMNMYYNGIEDNSIEINLSLREFYIFQTTDEFPHRKSKVLKRKGKTYIADEEYLHDVNYWDSTFGSTSGTDYDLAMLFTRHRLYDSASKRCDTSGVSTFLGVCVKGKRTSVVEAGDYFMTVATGTHELGHTIGAIHDGDGNAKVCKAMDFFIMAPCPPVFDPAKPYSRNTWMFSNCSVEAFKKTLKTKKCVKNKGVFFNERIWMMYVTKLPGEFYTLNQQCEHINGPNSTACGDVSEAICRFMKCTDPNTGECLSKYVGAATGTNCGLNMWCKEGMCVSKDTNGSKPECDSLSQV